MATNAQGTRPAGDSSDPLKTVPVPATPLVTPTNVGSVGVYDRDADGVDDLSRRRTSASLADDLPPAETRSNNSTFTWIISAIVLITLIYFILQWIF